MAKHFLPLISKHGDGKLIYITSKSGSFGVVPHSLPIPPPQQVHLNQILTILIATDHDGEVIGYRMAKAAANQQVKTLALDFQRANINVSTLVFELGFIKTRLTGWRGRVDIEESCNGKVSIIEKLTPEKSGSFVDGTGETIPW